MLFPQLTEVSFIIIANESILPHPLRARMSVRLLPAWFPCHSLVYSIFRNILPWARNISNYMKIPSNWSPWRNQLRQCREDLLSGWWELFMSLFYEWKSPPLWPLAINYSPSMPLRIENRIIVPVADDTLSLSLSLSLSRKMKISFAENRRHQDSRCWSTFLLFFFFFFLKIRAFRITRISFWFRDARINEILIALTW